MLQGGVEEETKKKTGELKKSPAKERIENVKFMETTSGVKRTREMTRTYEETTSRANTIKKFTINACMSVQPQEEWTKAFFTNSIRTTTTISTSEERLTELEVYKKCSVMQTDIFCERIRQVEKKFKEDIDNLTTQMVNSMVGIR
jgi:hypothetical protein